MQLPDTFLFHVKGRPSDTYFAERFGTASYRIYVHPKIPGAEFGTHMKADIVSALRSNVWILAETKPDTFDNNHEASTLLNHD